ncbi:MULTISPECIES: fimbrial protein [unclassified Serratia (in: enterobacteria)]|uniref:fimbrial protein n=1 Tax=unclassified Serratia (in: enterobacteria) TaxID=2647522 RepID=UPI003076794A
MAGNLTIEFIKTGPISSEGGTFGPGKLGSLYVSNANVAGDYVIYYLSSAMTVKPTTPACTVTSSSITVPLPDTNQSALNTAGSTSGATSFTIPLRCTAATSLSLSFRGDMADSSKGVFKNTHSANAANVGIQILKDGTPVPTATDSYVNIGSVNGSLNVPLTARYYALTPGVPAGAVSAMAYASIVYN